MTFLELLILHRRYRPYAQSSESGGNGAYVMLRSLWEKCQRLSKAQFITGWTGHVDLVQSRWPTLLFVRIAVREGDEFDSANLGSKPFVHFKPDTTGDQDRPLGCIR